MVDQVSTLPVPCSDCGSFDLKPRILVLPLGFDNDCLGHMRSSFEEIGDGSSSGVETEAIDQSEDQELASLFV